MLFYRRSRASLEIQHNESFVWAKLNEEEATIELDEKSLLPESTSENDKPRHLEEASKRIKQLSQIGRTFLDEQGVHVIYAVFGWLNWIDESRPPRPGEDTVELSNGKKARKIRSPLLFVPISIERTAKGAIRAKLEENAVIESNIALESYLNQQHGVSINLDPEDDLTPSIVIKAWRQVVSNYKHWNVEERETVLIDSFSFRKISLLRQLERSVDRIKEQSVLRALCGDAQQLLEAPPVPSYDDLDDSKIADRLNIVVPADSSQIKALHAVECGTNLVIQGPPGTGKSQTITNIISTLIANNKRVLFIAEKRPAREIVVENLIACKLGDIVLHITEEVRGQRGRSDAKRDIVDQLSDILEQGAGTYTIDRDYQADYERICSELNHYERVLHNRIGPSSTSTPFQLMANWAHLDPALAKAVGEHLSLPSITKVNNIWIEQAFEFASRIDDLNEGVLNSTSSPWFEAQISAWDSTTEADILSALSILLEAPKHITELLQKHRAESGLGREYTFRQLENHIRLLTSVGEHYKTKQRTFGIVTTTYWRTRGDFSRFEATSGINADFALHTSVQLRELLDVIRKACGLIATLFPKYSNTESITELSQFANQLQNSIDTAPKCAQIRGRCLDAKDTGITELLLELVRLREPGEIIKEALEATLAKHWAIESIESDKSLLTEGSTLNRLAEHLREYEKQATINARASVLNTVAPHRPNPLIPAPKDSELGILKQQINARKRKSLRWLFTRAANLVLQMKPCIVASPLAVAQFLQSDAYEFDVVVFDEASQIPTADAVVPISRARQVVVVGDSQQMPPTNYFDKAVSLDTEDADEFDFDSVLQNCAAMLPSLSLNWHYRSQDERLIAFSNHHFYGGNLLTFPSAWIEHPELGVKFVYIDNAVYGRGGSRANPEEAERVISILEEELKSDPQQEVGIIAMSITQATEIEARLEQKAQSSNYIREWLDSGGRARNLETVQGDEFDVSIISFGYGRDSAGNLQLNFGPLLRADGYKRLNVCITRARKRMIVVSSIRGADIPPARVQEGGQRVRQFLEYAEHGSITLSSVPEKTSSVFVYESPFEQQVANEIMASGWSVDTQVGVQKFRVDLGVKHPEYAGKYLAGIECDGATYHSHETARDRDIGRQQVLERLGWRIFRIWSTDWFRDKELVLQKVNEFLTSLLNEENGNGADARTPRDPEPGGPITEKNSGPQFERLNPNHKLGNVGYRIDIQHYTDQELLRALSLACFEVGSIPKAELIRFTTRFLGFSRVTKRITFRLESLVSEAIQEEYLREDGERYLPGEQSKYHFTVVAEEAPKTREERIAEAVIRPSLDKPAATKLHPKQPVSTKVTTWSYVKQSYKSGQAIRIRYRNAAGYTTSRIVEVLGVSTNYFDAFDHLRNEQRTFRIDRIMKAEWVGIRRQKARYYSPSSLVAHCK